MAFRRHYSVCAPCGPARASLLTGMYMQNHRSVRNGTPLDNRHTNIAREVRKAGYTDTSLDPRHHEEAEVLSHGYENLMPGFEEGLLLSAEKPEPWLLYLREQGYELDSLEQAFEPVANYPGSEGRGRTFAAARYAAEHSQTSFLAQKTIEHIGKCDGNWFLHLSWLRPHPPFIAPEPYNSMYHPDDVPLPARASAPSLQAEKHPWLASALGLHGDWFDPWMREILGNDHYEREMCQVRATYYGLVTKVDYYVGKIVQAL
jgi:arylsulfatase A-like enzyme